MPPSPQQPTSSRHRPSSPSVSIVVPVTDAAGLRLSLRGLPVVDEVVVVTGETGAEALGFIRTACPDAVLVQPTRAGVGNALTCGFAASSGDIVVALNGDGSTDPGEIPRYVAALLCGADVALGSRYRDGGRDLTGGRFRRWGALLLIWLVNVLFRVRRTDPGFGYAAFWRDAIDRLDLPDPSLSGAAAWGDGPEFAALLTVRTAARNLAVAEVGSVAYPRIRRAPGTAHTTLRHWSRTLAGEYAHRTRTARHAAGTPRPATFSIGRVTPVPTDPAPLDRRAGYAARLARPAGNPEVHTWMSGYPSQRRRDIRPRTAPDRSESPTADIRAGRPQTLPAMTVTAAPTAIGSAFSTPTEPESADGRDGNGPDYNDGRKRTGTESTDGRDRVGRREVGNRRRRLEGLRQQPTLRVINGEGGGTTRGRGGRLRAVPRENPGG